MSGPIELIEAAPPLVNDGEQADDVFLYGFDLTNPPATGPQKAIIYGFCFQGHCYRLSIPVEFKFGKAGQNPTPASLPGVGCGFDFQDADYKRWRMWRVEKTEGTKRIERRTGTFEELLLDFNLPGRSPATLTYSAKVAIAGKGGKIYE